MLVKAVVYEKYGSPDVLELREVDTPAPKDDEALVRIHAVSINDWDWALLPGTHSWLASCPASSVRGRQYLAAT